ncbi:thioredoxin domain-containing protein [Candidatus Azambacteria bacterium]|nr:thioredoxin domain-containing protein [Candidatus Azambacteria bacterium]
MDNETQQTAPVPPEAGRGSLPQKANAWSVPVAIIAAGIIVALAIFYGGLAERRAAAPDLGKKAGLTEPTTAPGQQAPAAITIKAVSAADHIFGDINAPVKVVEFSDLECPFCKRFHVTMQQTVAAYSGQVAWVYRHFPIDQLHSKARKEAEATECAGELGGNDKFWAYTNRLIEVTPSNNGLDLAELPKIAKYVGLDAAKFTQCLESGKYASKIEAEIQEAVAAGARGTPYSVVISASGEKSVIPGALPFEDARQPLDVKRIIDAAL